MSLFCWTQRKIFWRMWETEQFWGTIDIHSIYFFLLWKSMVPQNSLVTNFFKISSFVFSRTKTFIQVWNYLRVSKWWQNFNFWVNYPFNVSIYYLKPLNASVKQSWTLLFVINRFNQTWIPLTSSPVLFSIAVRRSFRSFFRLGQAVSNFLLPLHQLVLFRLEFLGICLHSVFPVLVLFHTCEG